MTQFANKPLALAAPLALTFGSALFLLAACQAPPPPVARGTLDCPESEGKLVRQAMAPDHRSCVYADEHGREVTLRILATGGDATRALASVESDLLGAARAPLAPQAGAPATANAEADRVARQAAADATAKGDGSEPSPTPEPGQDSVDVRVPGARVRADDSAARISAPGVEITADDKRAIVNIGGVEISADDDDDSVVVRRAPKAVRMRGEQLSRERRGLRASFLSNQAAGYEYVGYEAGGPRKGPLAIAVVRVKGEAHHEHLRLGRDVKRLVRRNGGI